jgi:hypothetical protein
MSTSVGTDVDFDPAELDGEEGNGSSPPIWTRRLGSLECSVWQGVSRNGFATFSAKLRKSYKSDEVDGEGKAVYKDSDYLFQQELPAAALLLTMAAQFIVSVQAKSRKK